MAKVFAITNASATVRLTRQARGECVFTVTNTAARPLRGRMLPVALDAVAQRWLSVAGAVEREFAAGQTTQVAVVITPAAGAEGRFGFRLDMEAVGEADGRTVGPAAYLTIEAGAVPLPPARTSSWWWLVAVGLLLVLTGLGLWLWLRGHGATAAQEPAAVAAPPAAPPAPAAASAPEPSAAARLPEPERRLPEPERLAAAPSARPALPPEAPEHAPAAAAPAAGPRESAEPPQASAPAAVAQQWLAALRERDLPRLAQLCELPFLCDGELVRVEADLAERYRRLASGDFAGIAAKRMVAKRVADLRAGGKALPAAVAQLRLGDDDQVVAVLAAAGGKELHLLLYLRGDGRLAGFTR